MKKSFIMAVAAIAALSSCSNDDILSIENGNNTAKAPVFTATIESEGNTRTVLSNNKVNWASGDKVFIAAFTENDAATVVVGDYSVTPGSDATTATLSQSNLLYSADGEPATIIGIYPASIAYYNGDPELQQRVGMNAASMPNVIKWGALSLNLPTEQIYNENDISQIAPMVSISSSTNLEFKNLSALLAITVKANDFTSVRSIKVSSEDGYALSGGSFDINDQSLILETSFMDDYYNYVTLNCQSEGANTTIPSGGSKTFYVSIPANTYSYLQIDVTDGTSTKTMKTKASSITVARNNIYNIAFEDNQTPAADPNLLKGKFTVSAGKQVQFTKGNLYWDGSAFKFETTQTDFPTSWQTNHVGHFFWSKTASVMYAGTYSDDDATAEDNFFFCEANKDNEANKVEGTSGLYALSQAEWQYLFQTRTDAWALYKTGVSITTSNGTVTGCIIIAPDGYDWVNNPLTTTYSAEAWAAAEALGMVCLPAGGQRSGNSIFTGSVNYWSSTSYDLNNAFFVRSSKYMSSYNLLLDSGDYRNSGDLIRLVK